jgi:DNA-binding NarL/FixJ family response regulator
MASLTEEERLAASAKRLALRHVERKTSQSQEASHSRDHAIRDALEEGCSIREVAAAANLSPARVHQIRHGK